MSTPLTRTQLLAAHHNAARATEIITATRAAISAARLRSNASMPIPALPGPIVVADPNTRVLATVDNDLISATVTERRQAGMNRLCALLGFKLAEIADDQARIRTALEALTTTTPAAAAPAAA